MYQQFFGLKELPFELTSNPKYLFMTPGHREALSNLKYGLATHKPVTLLIGEAGTGKTTLLRAALDSEPCRATTCVYVNNPALTREEFVETLARGFGLSEAAQRSKATMLAELEVLLRNRRRGGQSLALVVDEAQRLSDDLLEEVRLLANIETAEEKLLPLVVAGQPELGERLQAPELKQWRQRVSLRCEIAPFELRDTAGYISHRFRMAGGHAVNVFTREAITLIHDRSQGIPRTINVVCDNTLVGAFAHGVRRITAELVDEVCRDFDLGRVVDAGAGNAAASGPALGVAEPVPDAEPAALDADGPAPLSAGVPGAESTRPPVQLFGEAARRRRFSLFG